ncbi:unnamed protein product [Cyprideis torosa]|uniref:Uncharacterized protein n=1 Tax=Cyprideis torosa TaxID=163714 RepID=A0A7R8WHE8_9CRUS|nr:unnamed protein product [Cyprideis torosa]CAG0894120.1 unnamed protein product [Cyprideis torosa]
MAVSLSQFSVKFVPAETLELAKALAHVSLHEETKAFLEDSVTIPTGFSSLDECLGGGLQSGEITELVSEPKVGKTEFCLRVALNIAVNFKAETIWLDCNCHLRLQRVVEILKEKGIDQSSEVFKKVLSRIHYKRCNGFTSVFDALQEIQRDLEILDCNTFASNEKKRTFKNVRLLVVDSIPSLALPAVVENDPSFGFRC